MEGQLILIQSGTAKRSFRKREEEERKRKKEQEREKERRIKKESIRKIVEHLLDSRRSQVGHLG